VLWEDGRQCNGPPSSMSKLTPEGVGVSAPAYVSAMSAFGRSASGLTIDRNANEHRQEHEAAVHHGRQDNEKDSSKTLRFTGHISSVLQEAPGRRKQQYPQATLSPVRVVSVRCCR
jgi:hypothetical protein